MNSCEWRCGAVFRLCAKCCICTCLIKVLKNGKGYVSFTAWHTLYFSVYTFYEEQLFVCLTRERVMNVVDY